ncbi:hypothetical protein HHL23_19590 [Chryseobacterium sp. RP-3-3]|uniref:Uncharacterized protein n=1 Tax=Chryseobacterium antibioticum TaxID=2728847 RepID=A0A7Y0FT77_9FLAO|nr:hypothetical protein [Chryseobacterium antibioticum]NML71983.1 hypothetical protein [Chryseobacterium antibioticum]
MKKLKKISRGELKKLYGGRINPNDDTMTEVGQGGPEKTYKCCSDLYTCGSCSTGSNCPSGYFLKAC